VWLGLGGGRGGGGDLSIPVLYGYIVYPGILAGYK